MEEDNNTIEIPSAITTKQRVLQARGLEVPLDYFLYSCLERERLEKATIGDAQPHIAWPVLPKVGEEGPVAAVESGQLNYLLRSLLLWYRETFAELSEDRAIDHEQLLKVVPAVVGLARDVAHLYREKTKETLPAFDRRAQPPAAWVDIEAALKEFFPRNQAMFLRYLQWTHAAEVREVFEPGSRPPVGRFAPPPLPRTMGRDGRPERGGGRFDRPDRGPRPDAPVPRREAGDEAPSEERSERFGAPRPPKRDRPDRDRPDRDRERGDRPRRDSGRPNRPAHPEGEEATARMTATALAEVDQAIETLTGSADQKEITLKPTNSFYRRLQHQKIVDAGYHSNSVGEGPDRAVQISRKDS